MGAVASMALHKDGKLLAVAGQNALSFWDLDLGSRLARYQLPYSVAAQGLAFSPRGDLLAVGLSSSIQLWDTAKLKR